MINKENIKTRGDVVCKIFYRSGDIKELNFRNTILRKGKEAIAKTLANEVDDPFSFFVDKMLFGTNGTVSEVPRFVDDSRNGLFGPALLSKSVISSIDPNSPNIAIFTSVITFDEGVGNSLNEMALQLDNGDLYSMVTFPDLGKTADMQIVWNWHLTIL